MLKVVLILQVLRQHLPQVINNYARELGILKDKDANFTGADVRNGITAIVSIKHPDPRFEGQTKTNLITRMQQRQYQRFVQDELPSFILTEILRL